MHCILVTTPSFIGVRGGGAGGAAAPPAKNISGKIRIKSYIFGQDQSQKYFFAYSFSILFRELSESNQNIQNYLFESMFREKRN